MLKAADSGLLFEAKSELVTSLVIDFLHSSKGPNKEALGQSVGIVLIQKNVSARELL